MKTCKRCGKILSDDAQFCSNCGSPQNESASAENMRQNNISNKNNVLAVLAMVFCIVGCVATPLASLLTNIDWETYLQTGKIALASFTYYTWVYLAFSVAVCVSLTVIVCLRIKRNQHIPIGLKIVVLLFVNVVAGIMLLCMGNSTARQPDSVHYEHIRDDQNPPKQDPPKAEDVFDMK